MRSPPGTFAEPLPPFRIPLDELKSETTLVQLESVQTRNVRRPVLFVSGSLKLACRDGVNVAIVTLSAGEVRLGVFGATEAVLFVTACAPNVEASLPATSWIRPEPGWLYATVTTSSFLTAVASVSVTVDPETETPVGEDCVVPFCLTTKALPAGVDPGFSGSSSVTVSVEPFTVAEVNDGAVVSMTIARELENAEEALVLSVAFACQ